MAAALPLGFYAIRTSRRALVRILLGVSLILLVVVALSTFSRAAILPLGVVLVGVLVRERRNKYVFPIVLLAALAVVLLTPLKYWERLTTLGELESSAIMDKSLRLRMEALQSAWKLFLQHPLTGVGVNNFIVRSPDLVGRRVVHNTYLETLVGVGIIGFGAYMMMLALTAREFLRAMRAKWSAQYQYMSSLAYYGLLSFITVLIGANFLSMAHSYDIWLPAAGGLAAGCIARRYTATPYGQPDPGAPGGAEVE
jgi:O-antigen ligase